MNARLILVAALLVALLIALGTVTWAVAAPAQPSSPAAQGAEVLAPEPSEVLVDAVHAPSATNTDVVQYGTMWHAQDPKHFKRFQPLGWGTEAQLKPAQAPGDKWVHIGLTHLSALLGTGRNIKLVEFCAKSSNGAATKPTYLDVWADEGFISTTAISWPANNNKHCITKTFSPTIWRQSLNLSVLLHFANGTDVITLYKAWERVE